MLSVDVGIFNISFSFPCNIQINHVDENEEMDFKIMLLSILGQDFLYLQEHYIEALSCDAFNVDVYVETISLNNVVINPTSGHHVEE